MVNIKEMGCVFYYFCTPQGQVLNTICVQMYVMLPMLVGLQSCDNIVMVVELQNLMDAYWTLSSLFLFGCAGTLLWQAGLFNFSKRLL